MISVGKRALAFVLAGLVAACTPSQDATPPAAAGKEPSSDTAAIDPASQPAKPSVGAQPGPTEQQPQVLEGIPSRIALPPKGADTPTMAAGAEVTYVCESGMPLRVAFDGALAHVAWTDGRRLRLSMTANESGSGERYAGEGFVLTRIANVVELTEQAGGQRWRCAEGAATA